MRFNKKSIWGVSCGFCSQHCLHEAEFLAIPARIQCMSNRTRLQNFIPYFPHNHFLWPPRLLLTVYQHTSQNCLFLHSTEIAATLCGPRLPPFSQLRGPEKQQKFALVLRERYVNTSTCHESFGAHLLAAGWVVKPDWRFIQHRFSLWEDHFIRQNLLPCSRSCKRTAAKGSPILPTQGHNDVPPWKDQQSYSTWPDGTSPQYSPKPEHFDKSVIYIILKNHLGII